MWVAFSTNDIVSFEQLGPGFLLFAFIPKTIFYVVARTCVLADLFASLRQVQVSLNEILNCMLQEYFPLFPFYTTIRRNASFCSLVTEL